MDLNLLLEAEKRGLLPPDKAALLSEARKRGLVPSGQSTAPPPADVPPVGDKTAWQQSPPDAQPHRDTLAEQLAYAPATRFAVGAGETLIGGPFQLGANLGSAAARKIGEMLPEGVQQYYDTSGDQLDEKVAEKQRAWEDLKRSTMQPGEWDVAGGLGGMAAGAAALPGAVPKALLGRIGYGAGTGAVMGAMAPQQQAGLEHNAQGAIIGGAVGGAFPALTEALSKAGKVLYHAGIEPHFEAGREAIKGRAYLDAGGERIDDIATALRNYVPKVKGSEAPAGEAAADAGSAEFSAMQNSAEGVLPSEYVARNKARDAARLATVREVGQTPEALAAAKALRARNAEANYGAVENDLVDADLGALEGTPAMQDALRAARTSAAQRRGYFPSEEGDQYTVRNLQRAKKALDDSISASQNSAAAGRVPTLSPGELTDAKRELVGKLGEASPGWQAARDQFAKESGPINQMEVGQYLEGKLTNALDEEAPQRAAAYAGALRDAPRTIKNAVTGSPRFQELTSVLNPEQVRAVESVRDDLAGMAEQQRLAKAGSRSGKNVMQVFTNSIDATGHSGQLPNLLSRPAMAFNFIMRRLKGQMDEKLAREIAQEMLDPKATGQAIERAITRRDDVARTAAALRARTTQGGALAGAAAARASAGE